MGIFKADKVLPSFSSRSDAFDFMFTERIHSGDDYETAAEKADKFADTISRNKGLPDKPQKPKNGIEKAVDTIGQIVAVKKEHPEVWELVVGGIGGLISGFSILTTKNERHETEVEVEEMDFDNMK